MRVRVKYKKLDEKWVGKFSFLGPKFDTFDFEIGEEFTVLGLYYNSIYPIVEFYKYGWGSTSSAPLFMFDIIDDTPSKYWKVRFNKEYKTLSLQPELFYDKYFHDKFSDQDLEAEKAFFELYDLMVEEDVTQCPNPKYKYAEALEDNWALCPECAEAFEVNPDDKVIKCPNVTCGTYLNNPYTREYLKKQKDLI